MAYSSTIAAFFPGETEEKYKSSLLGFWAPLFAATPACSRQVSKSKLYTYLLFPVSVISVLLIFCCSNSELLR